MQSTVEALIQLGPLPGSKFATTEILQKFEALLAKIQTPISNEEAMALLKLFGPDDCFGLAWSILHLIEASPNWPIAGALEGLDGEWIERLRERAE